MREIRLNPELGKYVRSVLIKKYKNNPENAPPKVLNAYNYNESFTAEELAVIKTIKITSEDQLSVLEYFPNLNDLILDGNIKNIDYAKYMPKNVNIEYLTIRNNSKIKRIDLSLFEEKKFFEVNIKKCENLEYVNGISKAQGDISIVGCPALINTSEIFNHMISILGGTGGELAIDIEKAPEFFKIFYNSGALTNELNKSKIDKYLKFYEINSSAINNGFELKHDLPIVRKLYSKAAEITKECNIDNNEGPLIKFIKYYDWVCENITYDYDALKSKTFIHSKNGIAYGVQGGTNSFINGLLLNSCICEGYAKALKFLCDCNGINTNLAYCDCNEVGHAIIQIETDMGAYYCDPTWDSGRNNYKYFMMTAEELENTHKNLKTNGKMKEGLQIDDDKRQELLSYIQESPINTHI